MSDQIKMSTGGAAANPPPPPEKRAGLAGHQPIPRPPPINPPQGTGVCPFCRSEKLGPGQGICDKCAQKALIAKTDNLTEKVAMELFTQTYMKFCSDERPDDALSVERAAKDSWDAAAIFVKEAMKRKNPVK